MRVFTYLEMRACICLCACYYVFVSMSVLRGCVHELKSVHMVVQANIWLHAHVYVCIFIMVFMHEYVLHMCKHASTWMPTWVCGKGEGKGL